MAGQDRGFANWHFGQGCDATGEGPAEPVQNMAQLAFVKIAAGQSSAAALRL